MILALIIIIIKINYITIILLKKYPNLQILSKLEKYIKIILNLLKIFWKIYIILKNIKSSIIKIYKILSFIYILVDLIKTIPYLLEIFIIFKILTKWSNSNQNHGIFVLFSIDPSVRKSSYSLALDLISHINDFSIYVYF